MTKKAFKDLTARGQKARLAKYDEINKEKHLISKLVTVVVPAKFRKNADGSESAVFRFRSYDKATGKVDWFNASAYVAKDKTELRAFYQGIKKGQLYHGLFTEKNGYKNVYSLFIRERNAKKAAK